MKGIVRAMTVAAVTLLASAAHAGDDDIQWNDAGDATRQISVAPGRLAEWCGHLQRGEHVQWRFGADDKLNFNVHYHEGRDVHFPTKQDHVENAEGTLDVALDQDYCWMWTNKGAKPVALKASLHKAH